VSPAPARTSNAEVIAAGRDLLESGGLDTVTMQAVALKVGVRAPSLYKRFPNRSALIAAITTTMLRELGERLEPMRHEPDAAVGLRALAVDYRAFAWANPRTFELQYMNLPLDSRPSLEDTAQAAAPVLDLAERLVGSERALEAARLVTAFANGFILMELSGAFRLGGDVDGSYRHGVDALVETLARDGRGQRSGVSQRR
jgi:AcrR family transcriptional regulator